MKTTTNEASHFDAHRKHWRVFLRQALLMALGLTLSLQPIVAQPFEGRIHAVITRGHQSMPLLYTVGANALRIEITVTNRPHPVDLWNLHSGELILLFPHNRSFVRLTAAMTNPSVPARHVLMKPNGTSAMPMPQGIGPQTTSSPGPAGRIGPTHLPGTRAMAQRPNLPQTPMSAGMPAMPMMPMPGGKMELKATDDTTNLLGYPCTRYELKRRGETMDIWATDRLLPFQPYVYNQPHRFGPPMIEEQWGGMVKARKLFPLLATLKFDNGVERFRFEVTSVRPQKPTPVDANLFQPPTNYFELQPSPF